MVLAFEWTKGNLLKSVKRRLDAFDLDMFLYVLVNFLYEAHTCGIELDIINDENILIRENYSFKEYILELEINSITRFEIEEADITEWKISNNKNENKNEDKIIINNKSSKKNIYLELIKM